MVCHGAFACRLALKGAVALYVGSLGLGCGLAAHDAPLSNGAETGGSGANGNGSGAPGNGGGQGGATGSGGEGASAVNVDPAALDSMNCAARPVSDCEGVETSYESNFGFDETPAFAECDRFNSFDGCGVLAFTFDERGCATSVSPDAGGWEASAHLSSLRACLADALARERFPCLALQQLSYRESCFVR